MGAMKDWKDQLNLDTIDTSRFDEMTSINKTNKTIMKTTEEINEKAEGYSLTNGTFGFKEGIKFVKPEGKKEIYEEIMSLAYLMEDKNDYEETEEGRNWSFIISQLQSLKLL